jgi:hypothetical protein
VLYAILEIKDTYGRGSFHLLTSIHHLVFEYIVVVVLIFWVRESR